MAARSVRPRVRSTAYGSRRHAPQSLCAQAAPARRRVPARSAPPSRRRRPRALAIAAPSRRCSHRSRSEPNSAPVRSRSGRRRAPRSVAAILLATRTCPRCNTARSRDPESAARTGVRRWRSRDCAHSAAGRSLRLPTARRCALRLGSHRLRVRCSVPPNRSARSRRSPRAHAPSPCGSRACRAARECRTPARDRPRRRHARRESRLSTARSRD